MADEEVRSATSTALRRRAEEKAAADTHRTPEPAAPLSAEQAQAVLHELRVHQIQLEMQNEELRRAQDALEAEKGKYFELYDLAPVGYCTVSEAGLILLSNLTASRMLGVARESLIRTPFIRLIRGEDQDSFHRFRQRLTNNGLSQTCELRMKRSDGTEFWVDFTATAIEEPGEGRVLRILLADISDRRRSERARHEVETRHQTILNASPDDITIADLEGRIELVSPAALGMFGYDRVEEILGRPVLDFIARRDHPRVTATMALMVAGLLPGPGEYLGLRRDGSTFDIEVNSQFIRDGADRISGMVFVIRDISHRRQSEAALRESEARLRLALAAAEQGLYDLNVQTGEAVVSPEYATMLGFDPATFRETNAAWIERLHPDDREPVAAAYRDYVAGLTTEYRIEFRQRTAAGDWKWILSLGRVVERGPDGAPLRMLGTHTDITERKRIEVDLRRQAEELRSRNQELNRFNRLAIGRELRMIELKSEVNELCLRLGEAPRHRGSEQPADPQLPGPVLP